MLVVEAVVYQVNRVSVVQMLMRSWEKAIVSLLQNVIDNQDQRRQACRRVHQAIIALSKDDV